MLEKEFKYYLAHQSDLVKQYDGKFLVIIGEEVVGSYDSHEEALWASQRQYELGTFLIQECTEGEGAYTQTFHSRVAFA
ncbi:MAG: hypothetical protein K2O53_02790 [Bacteroidales bacterium]|nr:hypothetical protein [Bacteroidales bacterium]